MVKNVGTPDRVLRLIIAAGLAALAYFGYLEGTAGLVAYVAAVIVALTAIVGVCPFYRLAGIDTCVKENSYSTTDDRSGL